MVLVIWDYQKANSVDFYQLVLNHMGAHKIQFSVPISDSRSIFQSNLPFSNTHGPLRLALAVEWERPFVVV